MIEKYFSKLLAALAIRETQIRTTLRFPLTPAKMTMTQQQQ